MLRFLTYKTGGPAASPGRLGKFAMAAVRFSKDPAEPARVHRAPCLACRQPACARGEGAWLMSTSDIRLDGQRVGDAGQIVRWAYESIRKRIRIVPSDVEQAHPLGDVAFVETAISLMGVKRSTRESARRRLQRLDNLRLNTQGRRSVPCLPHLYRLQ